MVQLICLFCTSFISLAVYLKYFNKNTKNIKNNNTNLFNGTSIIILLCYYFLAVLTNTFLMYILLYFVMKRNDLTFTVLFTLKYLLLSSFIALNIPILFEYISKLINKYIIDYIKFTDNSLDKIEKGINKFFKTRIGRIFVSVKNYVIKYKKQICTNIIFVIFIILQFYLFDYVIRKLVYNDIAFLSVDSLAPKNITLAIGMFVGTLLVLLPKICRKILIPIIYVINLLLFLVNYMLITIKSEAFSIYSLQIASEGFEYISFITKEINFSFIFVIIVSVVLFIITFKFNKKVISHSSKFGKVCIILIVCLFGINMRSEGLKTLENYNTVNDLYNVAFPGYYVDNFINSEKNISVLGLYEYTIKDIYYYFRDSNKTYGSKEEIDEKIESEEAMDSNDMTGIFKDKNLIMIMMESIDYVVVDNKTMPTLTRMMNTGWDFPHRYSSLSGGNSTIATEYASLSGLYYLYDNKYDVNNYSHSIPNLFLNNNYKVSSFHENKGTYYNRTQLHKSLGFKNSHFLLDMDLDDYKYYDDAQYFDNDELYKLVVPKDSKKPFMSFITTISGHGPYTNNVLCEDEKIDSENECIRYVSKKTDDMLASMLKRLEEDDLLDDTVIILYSDHPAYSYNYTDNELAGKFKNIDGNYKIKHIPFVIYSTEIEHKKYDDIIVNDIDFAPTILNLFGIDYDSRYYVGSDIFSDEHKNVAMFEDYTWYDGKIYSGTSEHDEYYIETSNYVKERIDFSKMLVSNNYYQNLDNSKKE